MITLLRVNAHNGKIAIVVSKITGVTTLPEGVLFGNSKTFIATGTSSNEGEGNGFYSTDCYDFVVAKLDAILKAEREKI